MHYAHTTTPPSLPSQFATAELAMQENEEERDRCFKRARGTRKETEEAEMPRITSWGRGEDGRLSIERRVRVCHRKTPRMRRRTPSEKCQEDYPSEERVRMRCETKHVQEVKRGVRPVSRPSYPRKTSRRYWYRCQSCSPPPPLGFAQPCMLACGPALDCMPNCCSPGLGLGWYMLRFMPLKFGLPIWPICG